MKYENISGYAGEKFRRITGVKRTTFEKMLGILSPAKKALTCKVGPKPKLSLEDMLLATLEYWEYRTYAHVAASYDVSESSVFRIIKWVEDTLIKDGTFSLPERKALFERLQAN